MKLKLQWVWKNGAEEGADTTERKDCRNRNWCTEEDTETEGKTSGNNRREKQWQEESTTYCRRSLNIEERATTGSGKTETAGKQQRLLRDDGNKVKQVMGIHRVLPLAGSGKIPWLRLLMTDDLGESWLSWEELVVLGEECCEVGLEELCRLWPEWDRLWWSPSLCSFRGSHLGMLSNWAVLDRSMSTWKQTQQIG